MPLVFVIIFPEQYRYISRCPVCHQDEIESLSLSSDEAYKFDYSSKRGVSLEFKKYNVNKGKGRV
jgi:hypothetical protein